MLSKALLAIAALGIVSVWYTRSRSPLGSTDASGRPSDAAWPASLPPSGPTESGAHNLAEDLQHSHAMGVAGGIEGPQVDNAAGESQASGEDPDRTTWPTSREFMRGA